jgi:hypothetical protein
LKEVYKARLLGFFLKEFFIIISSDTFEVVLVDEFFIDEFLFFFRGEEFLILGDNTEVSEEVFGGLSFEDYSIKRELRHVY